MGRIPKEKSFYAQKSYTGDQYEFQKVLEPTVDQPLSYKAQSLTWDESQTTPTGLIFKDLSKGNIKYLDKSHGLFSNEVYAIEEDSLGRIYFGTHDGLGVFNGEEMKIFRQESSFDFSDIRALQFDAEGRLWIGKAEGFAYIMGDSLYLPDQLLDVEIFGVSLSKDDQIILSTVNTGLVFIGTDQYKIIDQFDTPFICDYLEDRQGRQWVAKERFGISFIQNDSLFNIPRADHINSARVFFENDTALWIGTFAGDIHMFSNDSLFSLILSEDLGVFNTFGFESTDDKLWVATYGAGVFSIDDKGKVQHYNAQKGLTGDFAYDIHKDAFGNIWIADLQDGISRIDENIFFQADLSISNLSFAEIEVDSNGNRWFLPSGTYLTKETQNEYVQYSNETGGIFRLSTYAEDGFIRGDEVWMSNYGMGITVFSESGYTFYQDGEDFFANSVFHLEEDAGGGVWMITLDNKLVYFKDEKFFHYAEVEPFSKFEFNRVSRIGEGGIIAYTAKSGVFVIRDSHYWHLHDENGLASNEVAFAFQDDNQQTWLFQDGRIDIMDESDVIQPFDASILQNNPVKDALVLGTDSLLAITYNGLVILSLNDQELQTTLLGANYGINLPDNENVFYDGTKYLVSGHGNLFQFDPAYFRNVNVAPRVSIDRILVDDATINEWERYFEITQSSRLEIHFNMISWGRMARLNFQITKNDQSDNWRSQKNGIVDLNELDRGSYSLVAYIEDGFAKSSLQTISFTVTPYWYETWWALVGYTLLLIILGFSFVYYRGMRSKRQRAVLQMLVDQKTKELQLEKAVVTKQLKEKEILLKEVNHRVKNNLQIITSLLQMQTGKSNNDEVKEILTETEGRVRSMALVHQKLYESSNVSSIYIKEYTEQLIQHIKSSFGKENRFFNIEIKADAIALNIQTALPIGLIINELVTNAFKYGLDQDGHGRIYIGFELHQDHFVKFILRDSGPGLPENFDLDNTKSLGLRLVNILTRQLDGTLNTSNSNGALFELIFPFQT